MSQNHNNSNGNQMKPEFLSDPAPLSSEEQAYIRTLLSEEDLEKCYEAHCEAAHRKLWTYFQSAAASLTVLYRERDARRQPDDPTDTLWQPFQTAAGALTQVYRESLEGMRIGVEGVRRSGYQKCRRDIASWATLHRKRYIRRDELLSLLATGLESNPTEPQHGAHAQPLPEPPQEQLFMEAFSAASCGIPAGNVLSSSAIQPFNCNVTGPVNRSLKRPLCSTPPHQSSPGSDKDVHMDTPSSKKHKNSDS